MTLEIYNTRTRTSEVFKPFNADRVTMYVCGPTVYSRPHIGNARSVVVYDLLYRLLVNSYGSEKVVYARNITDVDDKIIKAAIDQNIDVQTLTSNIYDFFKKDMLFLNCLDPNIEPKATEHIAQMISMIKKLINSGHAYVTDNHVFFDVSTYPDYYKLSGRDHEELKSGYRIDNNSEKKNESDFVLWKKDESEAKGSIFDSPWGKGRPGWHIECSVMSTEYLGENFDIHGGGIDLIFPHHTNEVAQSCCANKGSDYANYWVHNGFLTVEGEKMSKSLNNFITIEDLVQDKYSGDAIRIFFLSTHYRKPLNWTHKGVEDAIKTENYFKNIFRSEKDISGGKIDYTFVEYLHDDMNTPKAIARLFEMGKEYFKASNPSDKKIIAANIYASCQLMGIMEKLENSQEGSQEIEGLIAARAKAKKEKNWQLADQIRDELDKKNVVIQDNPDGSSKWFIKH